VGNVVLRDLILANRSYRQFDEDAAVDEATLRELVDMARLSASAAAQRKHVSALPGLNIGQWHRL